MATVRPELVGRLASEIVPVIVESLGLSGVELMVIAHPVDKNWRERYRSTQQRLANIEQGLRQDVPLRTWTVSPPELSTFIREIHCERNSVISLCSRFPSFTSSKLPIPWKPAPDSPSIF